MKSDLEAFFSLAQNHPAEWMKMFLGLKLYDKQREIAESVAKNERTIVVGAHGLGKTTILTGLALWFVSVFPDAFVFVTAPTYRQIKDQFFRELKKRLRFAKFDFGGKTVENRFLYDEHQLITGISSDGKSQDLYTGYHDAHVLCILDQGGGPKTVYEAINGMLSSGHGRVIAVSNSAEPESYFAYIFNNPDKEPHWNRIRVTAFDNPNEKARRVVYKSLPHPGYCERRRKEWGESSPLYKIFILAEFVDLSNVSMFKFEDIEKSLYKNKIKVDEATDKLRISVDVAQSGGPSGDDSVVVAFVGKKLIEMKRLHTDQVDEICDAVSEIIEDWSSTYNLEEVAVDWLGPGMGVENELRKRDYPVRRHSNAERAIADDRFVNVRAESYWRLKEELSSLDLSLLDEEEKEILKEELFATSYLFTNDRIKIVEKAKIKKKIGRSPDLLDAIVMNRYKQDQEIIVDLFSELKKLKEEENDES